MAAKISDVRGLLEAFKKSYEADDIKSAEGLLIQVKVALTYFSSLPPLYQPSESAAEELALAREFWELAVLLSVKSKQENGFERHFLQLKTYYTDARHLIPLSPHEPLLLGLNLLRLLVQKRIAEFHTELELLPRDGQDHQCIRFVIELEQSLMEGAYNRVLDAGRRLPHPSYVYFMDALSKTVRNEIESCSAKAYDYLTVNAAKKLFVVDSGADFEDFVSERGWTLQNGRVVFHQRDSEPAYKEIPALQLISQTLGYARELERIV